jgi:hypothetical protein
LFTGIGGNVDLNGTWYNPSNQAMGSNLDTSSNLGGQYNYDYVVTSTICANDTSNVIVIVDASCDYTAIVEELMGQWEVYPNPATTTLTVSNNSGLSVSNMELLDLNGKVLYNSTWGNQLEKNIDISPLQTGMYILKLTFDGQTSSKRIIKQ